MIFFNNSKKPKPILHAWNQTIDRCFCGGGGGGGDGGTSRSTSGPISSVTIALSDGISLKKIGPLTVVEHSIPVHVIGFGDHKVPLTKTRRVRTVVGGHGTQATKGVALVALKWLIRSLAIHIPKLYMYLGTRNSLMLHSLGRWWLSNYLVQQ